MPLTTNQKAGSSNLSGRAINKRLTLTSQSIISSLWLFLWLLLGSLDSLAFVPFVDHGLELHRFIVHVRLG